MVLIYLWALGSAVIVSLVSFVGALLLPIYKERWIHWMVSLSVGALLGDAFLHLLPEAYIETQPSQIVSFGVIGGIMLFFILTKFLHWHHHHKIHQVTKPYAYSILVGDGMHNFLDGILLGAAYLTSLPAGIATTIAVVLHEIPQEIGDFGVLISAGYTRKKALLFNFLSALTALTGTILVLIIGNSLENLTLWLTPLAAGGFIYIACTDLVPELHKEHPKMSWQQLLFILLGLAFMVALLFIE